ncbi:MAG: hypothetical protein KME60_33355 [Cyanomargarita calcarea GSE-NOS-MK-12-04C]|jgi:hypothetical protein|uniref:Uncharacterized protein n=1 Tax=Cyanomargarita calcarea GSE-NOS-MK-12-04C TaxID=2839659 RepID=A0A951QUW7_9CYAN|nr:hypothetical protein [Cyanomargarita calcarea GSE-NOS-MK-12-04C]
MLAILFICTWVVMMFGFAYSVFLAFKEGKSQMQKLHRIPCYNCDFFTNNHRLKCTVHPTIACTEEALGCGDFELKNPNHNIYSQGKLFR